MSSSGANPLFPSSAWRFLLPTPAPGRTVYFGQGDGALMARELPGTVSDAGDGAEPADLVVGDDPEPAELGPMFDRLAPGGTLYVEYGRPGGGRQAERLRRRVAEAGFVDVRAFSVSARRTFQQPTWWIPQNEPAATAYLVGSRRAELRGYSRWRRAGEGAYLGLLTRFPRRLARSPWRLFPGLGHRLCLVARRPPQPGESAPAWLPEAVVLAGAAPDRAPPFLLRVGGTATDRAIVVVLDRHGRAPLSVAKLPVIEAEIVEAEREAAMLDALAGIPGVPRLVRHWQGTGYAGLAQSYVPGDRMDTLVARAELPQLAEAVTGWLVDLATATARAVDGRWLDDLAARSLDELAASLGGEPGLDRLLARSRRLLTFERPLPAVAQHRDLGPWNLLLGPEQAVGVIDWVDGTRDGVPMADLVHFLAHLVFGASGGYGRQVWDHIIGIMNDPATAAGAVVASCQRSYATRLDITATDIPRLRVLTWVLDILRQDPEHRAVSLYLTLWRTEVDRHGAG